jgi:hypothetical protein
MLTRARDQCEFALALAREISWAHSDAVKASSITRAVRLE